MEPERPLTLLTDCHLVLLLMTGTHQKRSPGECTVWADSGRGTALTPIPPPWPMRVGMRTEMGKPQKLMVVLCPTLA